jgi:hypothetical protein
MSAVVTTGAWLAATLIVKGDQWELSAALQAAPSKARIWILSATLPVTKLTWPS